MTTHLKDTHTLRAVTIPDATFDYHQLDRIIHLMECGRQTLSEDVKTFAKAAQEARESDSPNSVANTRAMSDMQLTFQRYVDEGTDLINRLRGLQYVGMLAFVDLDGDTSGLIEVLNEILQSEASNNG